MGKLMMRKAFLLSAMALGTVGIAGVAQAAPTITGSLTFVNPGFNANFFDPANSMAGVYGVPAGFGNSTSPNNVAINSGVEFGYDDLDNTDTADFTDNTLTVTDLVKSDAYQFVMTFVTTRSGFFNQAKLLDSQNFSGKAEISDSGRMLVVTSFGSPTGTVQFAKLGFLGTAAPEPATWAMMIMGFGFVGAAMRGKRSQGTLATA